MKKIKLLIAITFIGLLIAIVVFLNMPAKNQTTLIPHFDVSEEFVAIREHTDTEKQGIDIYRYIAPNTEAYAIGMNQYSKPVFKDPNKALAALYVDYADAISYINSTSKNFTSGLINGQGAIINTETDDPILRERIKFVIEFIVIFNDSFHK